LGLKIKLLWFQSSFVTIKSKEFAMNRFAFLSFNIVEDSRRAVEDSRSAFNSPAEKTRAAEDSWREGYILQSRASPPDQGGGSISIKVTM
jgi:hypothetical protein